MCRVVYNVWDFRAFGLLYVAILGQPFWQRKNRFLHNRPAEWQVNCVPVCSSRRLVCRRRQDGIVHRLISRWTIRVVAWTKKGFALFWPKPKSLFLKPTLPKLFVHAWRRQAWTKSLNRPRPTSALTSRRRLFALFRDSFVPPPRCPIVRSVWRFSVLSFFMAN